MSQTTQTPAPEKVRFVGIDLVKILACFLVVCVHFFLYTGFYNEPITQEFGQTQIYFRWIAYCCVPLFMITTGYLMKNKVLSKKYYFGMIRVFVIYLIISVICVIFNMYHFKLTYTPWSFIKGMFMFSNAQYAWYVEYYFTIFLIIPFINLAFNNLKTQKHKLTMVLTVVALTMVSQSFYLGINPDTQIRVFPGYFYRCYPIAYYLIGAYIRDFPPKRTLVNKFYFAGIYVVGMAWLGMTTYQHSLENADNNFIMLSRHYNDYGSWPVALCSVMLFLLIFDITCKNSFICRVIRVFSEATFACYLVSYVYDSHFYAIFSPKYPSVAERFQHAPEVIAKVFCCSMATGLIIQTAYTLGEMLVQRIIAGAK